MPDLTPYDAMVLIGLFVAVGILYRLSLALEARCAKHAQQRTQRARQEHLERLARMRTWSRRSAQPLPGRMPPPTAARPANPGPGLRPHPVHGTQHAPTHYSGWTMPPADLAPEAKPMPGIGDTLNTERGGGFAGAGASGSWETPSTYSSSDAGTSSSDSPSPATQD